MLIIALIFQIFVTFFCLGALASGNPLYDDGQWRGEGLAESQDRTNQYPIQYQQPLPYSTEPPFIIADSLRAISYVDPDGVVVIPEVTVRRARTLMRQLATSSGPWNANVAWVPMSPWGQGAGSAPIGADGRVVDTPEVAAAKAEHFAAKAAANAVAGAW